MRTHRYLSSELKLVMIIIAGSFIVGCSGFDPADLPDDPDLSVTEENVFIRDSFERTDLFQPDDIHQILFGWMGFIWDFGTPVQGLTGNNVEARIFSNQELGPVASGERALYFFGREGYSTHNLYLISRSYDLSEYNTAILSFKYLTFQLNDEKLNDEYLRVELCEASLEECGVADGNVDALSGALNPTGLQSNNWKVIFQHDSSQDLKTWNGRNHSISDWANGIAILDLRDNEGTNFDRSHVVFRFSARMRDGFVENNLTKDLVDGAAIDDVLGRASKLTIEDIF
ncbi:MAG: hypothetical protein A2Z20_00575 [Bdellovibrionales bacterium RBG_16_40_8]|nr:MAG: hypothetical protein A2Z20_00575 [Bdellovibrionales bacterium RBG_16_40_8]